MRFKQFTKPQVLASIDREHLGRLFGRFGPELQSRTLVLPDQTLPLDRDLGLFRRLTPSSTSSGPAVVPWGESWAPGQ
jgi:hypothetical protein